MFMLSAVVSRRCSRSNECGRVLASDHSDRCRRSKRSRILCLVGMVLLAIGRDCAWPGALCEALRLLSWQKPRRATELDGAIAERSYARAAARCDGTHLAP